MIGSSDISSTSPGSETGHAARPRAHDRNTRIPRPATLAAALGLAFILLLSGCGERGDVGIFASIEREEKIEKSNLPEVSTAGSMVYDAGEDKYYVALGQLYSRDRDKNNWEDVSHPSGYRDGHTLDIVILDADLSGTIGDDPQDGIYVAFFDTQSTKSELFELNPANDNFNKVWSPGKEISKLIGVDTDGDGIDDALFAVTVESSKTEYDLIYAPNNIGDTQGTPLNDVGRIIDGTYDHVNTQHFFAGPGQLYRGATPGTISAISDPSDMPFANYGGITFVADPFGNAGQGWLYVTSKKGDVAYTTDSSAGSGSVTWTTSSADNERRYTDIAYVDFSPDFTGLTVGLDTRETSSGGYYEVNEALGTSSPDGDNYRAADISDASIHGFYVDTANQTLFALTNGDGLWSATYDNGEPKWSWE